VDDPTAEKGDEVSSNQALSEENQARLKEVFSLLQRDIQDQVRDLIVWSKYLNLLIKNFQAISKFSWSPSLIWTIIMQR
jgi:hypothetical protein